MGWENLLNELKLNNMPLQIKKGQSYLCIKDYTMEDGEIVFTEGKVYQSDIDRCLTNNNNNPEHHMTDTTDFFEHFQLLEGTNEELLPFKLEEYKKNPERLRQFDGTKPLISKWDDDFNTVLVRWHDNVLNYTEKHFTFLRLTPLPKKEYWVNVYVYKDDSRPCVGQVFSTEREALDGRTVAKTDYIKTIKFEI